MSIPHEPATSREEARQASAEARHKVAQQRSMWGEIRSLVSSLRKENDFSARIDEALRERN